MNKQRVAKGDAIEGLKAAMAGQTFGVVVESQGLSVMEVTGLRTKIRGAGAVFRVTKNTLARIALKGTPFENLISFLKGPTALAFAKDPVGVAKVLVDFAKGNDKLKVIGANMDGQLLDAKATQKLASLPPLNELRARIVGILQTPATRMAVLLKAPAGQIARVLAAKAKKEGG
ncbi:MAG: 50S ribosomal protein L10 [Proteobacteria bacterium]|nr:50S ribosomal protein L10 [Pseudomonadota bacterium]